jgi:hypothetical protein
MASKGVLSMLAVLASLASMATSNFVLPEDIFWSGRPQPIGIDFASNAA